ncbi:MAG: hypothetical protein FWC40_00300 [Proteobacteria bacterium]|nr:hypothetical protein [Pseudomonadota bacterium]
MSFLFQNEKGPSFPGMMDSVRWQEYCFYSFMQNADKFILAIVLVNGDKHEGSFYVRQPFAQEPDWAVTSIDLGLNELLKKAQTSC